MRAAELRQSILQAAAQGKLVSQNPQDEPASRLFERIQKEKIRLIKEGKIKKEKPLPEIVKNEMPFEIPENWCWVRLGDIAQLSLGKMLDKAKNQGVLRPYLRNINVRWGNFDFFDVLEMRFKPEEEQRYSIKNGDLVVCEGGEPGRCAVWIDEKNGFLIQKALHRVRFYSGINAFFAFYLFQLYSANGYFSLRYTGTTIKHLPGNILASIAVPLPPFAEQQLIVAKLDELMLLCDELEAEEKKLDALEAHFTEYLPKAILQAAVHGNLVPQGTYDEPASELLKRSQKEKERLVKAGKIKKDKSLPPVTENEIPYHLPDGWVWCRLSDVGQIVGGATPDSQNSAYYTGPGQGIPWITPADMQNAKNSRISCGSKDITQEGYDSCSTTLLPQGSVVFSSRAPIGHIAFADNELCTNQGFKSVVPYEAMLAPWVFFALKSKVEDIESRASGTTFKEVSGRFMEKELLPLPPLAEQQRIVAKIEELFALCGEMKTAYTKPVEFDKVSEIIPFPAPPTIEQTEESTEPLLLAARGDAENLSSEALKAIDDLFAEDAE